MTVTQRSSCSWYLTLLLRMRMPNYFQILNLSSWLTKFLWFDVYSQTCTSGHLAIAATSTQQPLPVPLKNQYLIIHVLSILSLATTFQGGKSGLLREVMRLSRWSLIQGHESRWVWAEDPVHNETSAPKAGDVRQFPLYSESTKCAGLTHIVSSCIESFYQLGWWVFFKGNFWRWV